MQIFRNSTFKTVLAGEYKRGYEAGNKSVQAFGKLIGKQEGKQEVKAHVLHMIAAREEISKKATKEFNKGLKFATDYVLEYINIQQKKTRKVE